ncbi:MAG: C-GCAxxG-C-C family protein [Clostridium sp.]|nr:C-GCAxxG-C-C family protein [Prevotella sp.]MCM1428334.1 C-GCAxxG-C-C family protein [Clostridium sp.]MCM1474806.1 C-GCAxxG-C-C family protein [Muribaculaceae bacterium]
MINYTTEERLEKCRALRREGYNCAQSVIMCFDDITGLPKEVAAKISSALGSGVAGCRQICGVANAMAMTIGMTHGEDAASKVAAVKEARPLLDEFSAACHGRFNCCDLKGKEDILPCDDLVALGVGILDCHFRNKNI